MKITAEAADAVFFRATVPKYFQKMISAFPNAKKLPGPDQDPLLSLIFNRGIPLKGNRPRSPRHEKTVGR
jgi:hypothetical protein